MSKPKKGVFGGYKLELAQGENLPNINISHGVACGTLTPVSILDFLHKRILIDCPPFSDSMSEQNDFNHAVDIHKVLKGRIRVILTLDEYIFDDQRGQRFTFMLNKLTEIFPDQDQLKKVLYLVVNKEKLMSVNKNLKSHILDGRPSYLTKRGYDLLQFLISNPEHIADFKAPIEEGPYNVSESLQQVLNSTHYVNNPKICPPVEKSVMSSYQNRWSSLHPYDEKGEQSNY